MLSFRDIARIFEEIELRLIASLKRNLSRHKAEEEKEGFEWSAWQAEKLNNIDNFRKENAQIADKYVDVIDDETRQLMTDQFHEGEHTAEQSVIDVSESGVNVPDVPAQPQPPEAPTAIPDDHFFGVNKPKMDKLMEDVTTLEKTALTAAVRNMDDVLRRDYSREKIYSGKGELKQTAPRTEEVPVKVTDTESKNPVPTNKEPNIPQPDNNISEPENNVSKPENNENTMNFVQSEPIKPVQSNEDTDDTPTAVVSDEAVETVETAKTTENVQETVKQPVEATADSEEDVQNFTDDTVDNSDESDIIDIERSMAAKSFDKATKYARKELKISISSLSELPLETVNAINSSMHRLYQEIPVLKGSVSEVVLEDMAEIAKASVSWLDGTTPRIRIKINSLLFQSGSIGEIEQHIAQIAINHEITPKDGIYGLLLHESVHIREYLITAKKCSSLAEFKLSLDSFEEAKSIMNTALANCGLLSDTRVCERFLSEYATENPAEFIAEAFSSTENNDLVLEVKRLLKKKWGM